MKDGIDAASVERLQQSRAPIQILHEHRVEMSIRSALGRYDGAAKEPFALEQLTVRMIQIPDRASLASQSLGLLELRPQERGRDLARQVRRADVDPRVLVDLPAEELAAVGALLSHDLSTLDPPGIVQQQRAAFAGDDVLRLVEAQRRARTEAAEWPAAVLRHQ